MNKIQLNNKIIDLNTLKTSVFSSDLSDYERALLQFCKDWLCGQQDFLIQTSGSTGVPKQIKISRKQMSLSAQMTAKTLGLGKGDKALICLNTDYIAGKMMLVRALEIGMKMTIFSPTSNPFNQIENNSSFDFIALVPLQLQTILKESPSNIKILNRMKAIIIGGAHVNRELEEEIQRIKSPVYLTYGMTETVSHIALRRLNGKDKSEFYETLENVEIGMDERNCLTIISPLTNNQLLVTNDIVEIVDNTKFRWLGRIDNIINSGGIKIQPEKIEAELGKIFFSFNIKNRFFVSAVPHKELGEMLILIIEGNNLPLLTEEEILNQLKKRFDKKEIPKQIFYLDKFIETNSGKINRGLSSKNCLQNNN